MLKDFLLGNKHLQPFYEFLFKVAYKGMNYDRGHVPDLSGEKYVLKLLEKNSREQSLNIFDVGANVGQYAQLVLSTIKKPVQLYSFEPQPAAYAKLIKTCDKDFFHPNNMALGSKAGTEKMFYNNQGSVFASMFPAKYETYSIDLNQQQEVKVSTLDEYCTANNITRIDFLKMDVEGYEMEVLKGAKQLLAKKAIKMVQFEFGIASIEARIYLKDFFTTLDGFDIYRILQNGIRKLHYSEYIEIFSPTNYLAILRD